MEKNKRLGRLVQAEVMPPSPLLTSSLEANSASSLVTWEQAVRVLRKRRWFLLGFVGAVTLVVVVAALTMRDVYRPTARLEIDPLGSAITTLHEIDNSRSLADQDYLDTQVQILQSEGLAMRVIRSLHLDRNSQFAGASNAPQSAASANAPTAPVPKSEDSHLQEQLDLATMTPTEATALQAFRARLSVSPVRGSRLVEVSFAGNDPKLAQTVTNSLVTQFIDQNYRNRYVTTMEASEWLSSQLNDLRRKVAESNQAVADYQRRYGLVEADQRDVPLVQLMGEVSRQLSDAQADRIQAEASVRMIDGGRVDAIPSLRDDAVYQNLLTRYAEVRSQLAQALITYGDESTNVKKLKGEADELAAQVDAERERLIKRVRASFETAKAREQMMAEVREKIRAQMGDASSHLVEYGTLKNEALANASLYNTLQARLQEAGIFAGLRSENIRVVDMAPALLKPTGPHRGLIVGLGVTLAVILALGLTFVWESFDNTVRVPDDIRNWVRLPALAIVPSIVEEKTKSLLPADTTLTSQADLQPSGSVSLPKLFWSRTQSAEAEAIRSLRSALLTRLPEPAPQVILVSSPSTGEGKTTVALNLACVLAQHGKTCLVEGDLRRPMIESALNLNPSAGLGEVLAGELPVSNVLLAAPGVSGLTVLPIKTLQANPADLLASGEMINVLRSLLDQFEHVVIDSPPILSFSDARILASMSDAVILVSRYGFTTRRAIARSAELLAGVKAPLLGVVLNDMGLSSPDYHYLNYGYSWAASGRKYEQVYRPFVSPAAPQKNESEKSKGAHA